MTNKIKIALCFFGVLPRSIKYTYKTINNNIINVIKSDSKFDLKIYGFNLNVGKTLVDGCILDQSDVKLLNFDYYEEYEQSLFDTNEYVELSKKTDIKFRSDYPDFQIRNAVRQMYSEFRVGVFLENHPEIDIAIVCGPDFFIANKLNLQDIYNLESEKNIIYTTCMNDAQGYTNGFYIGKSLDLIKILKRFDKADIYLPTNTDYEHLLYKSFVENSISRKITNLVFFKIRANKDVFWRGTYYNLSDCELKNVVDKYNELKANKLNNHFLI